jgi:hypothetical protein
MPSLKCIARLSLGVVLASSVGCVRRSPSTQHLTPGTWPDVTLHRLTLRQ